MSELASQVSQWQQRADAILAHGGVASGEIGTFKEIWELLLEGIGLRRQLDGLNTEEIEREPHFILLTRMRHRVLEILHPNPPASLTPVQRDSLRELLRSRLPSEEEFLEQWLAVPAEEPVRVRVMEGLQRDWQWFDSLLDVLAGASPPGSLQSARVELDRLEARLTSLLRPKTSTARRSQGRFRFRKSTTDASGDGDKTGWESAGDRVVLECRSLRRDLLSERVRREIAQPTNALTAEELWSRRFAMTRLAMQGSFPERIGLLVDRSKPTDKGVRPQPLASLPELESYRERLSQEAQAKLEQLPLEDRRTTWDYILALAGGESNDTTAFLEELTLPAAVRSLELSYSDAHALLNTGERLAKLTDKSVIDIYDIGPTLGTARRLVRRARNELQEKRLAQRMEQAFGHRFVVFLENLVLLLILVMTGLIATEWYFESRGTISHWQREIFAWCDLGICLVFLGDFFLRLTLAQGKWLYFRRHFVVDFLAAIPFGFLFHYAGAGELSATEDAPQLLRLLRLMRLPQLARYIRIAQPIVRLGRLVIFLLRATDQLVRRNGALFNRNILLFEPQQPIDTPRLVRRQLSQLRDNLSRRLAERQRLLGTAEQIGLVEQGIADLRVSMDVIPQSARIADQEVTPQREIRAELVIERLTEMTPEQLVEQQGLAFAETIARYVRLFDAPLVRRLPLIKELVEQRRQGPAHVAALAANYAGIALQSMLNVVFFLADLQGTISGPVFLDRLGSTLIAAAARPAKRLLMLGGLLLILYVLVRILPTPGIVMFGAGKIEKLLGVPVIVLGIVCLIPWGLGVWLTKIANQASEYCERLVEAQFASQTKRLKTVREADDFKTLTDRVLFPEVRLRRCDEPPFFKLDMEDLPAVSSLDDVRQMLARDEALFLDRFELLYSDYLDGSIFHRSDTRTTTHLLGSLALQNLRMSNLMLVKQIHRKLESLDDGRSRGKLLGGPFLWFHFITRMITQHTARLLIDYNRHAVPLDRLRCTSQVVRGDFRHWLSERLLIEPEEVSLPEPIGRHGGSEAGTDALLHPLAEQQLQTIDFTALDFLTANPSRDFHLRQMYGDQVMELLARDRKFNVRRAFRCFPLHDVPAAQRTVNFFDLYETFLARGSVLLLPFRMIGWTLRLVWIAICGVVRVVRDVLNPRVANEESTRVDHYSVARRKIHRMRKPIFMGSFWLRAYLDVEYLGIGLPDVPYISGMVSVMESDLEFIGATRRERLAAQKLQCDQFERLNILKRWLVEYGIDFPHLGDHLQANFPHLTNRGAEVTRALTVATLLDYHDLYTLSSSIETMGRLVETALSIPEEDFDKQWRTLPEDLPLKLPPANQRWYRGNPVTKAVRGVPANPGAHPGRRLRYLEEIFDFPEYAAIPHRQQIHVLRYLRRQWVVVKPFAEVLLGQGGDNPRATLLYRWNEVMAQTDLWSNQILSLRTIQTLTMLDVQHYCAMVWQLGGYGERHDPSLDVGMPKEHHLQDAANPPLDELQAPTLFSIEEEFSEGEGHYGEDAVGDNGSDTIARGSKGEQASSSLDTHAEP